MQQTRSEFNVANQHRYDYRSGPRWLISHVLRYKWVLAATIIGVIGQNILNSTMYKLVGQAFDKLLQTSPDRHALYVISAVLLAIVLVRSALDLLASFGAEIIAKRIERDARDELYLSLLGKSQTFHNRQRVGDLMARAANDVRSLNDMVSPGLSLITDSMTALVTPIIFIAFLDWRLLLMPALFTVGFYVTVRRYIANLKPVSFAMRANFGAMNAGLNEAVTGIEVVKSTAQEEQEHAKFEKNARAYRDAAVKQGVVQSRYLPTLVLAVTLAGALLQGIWMVTRGDITVGQLVTFFGLMQLLRFPTFISIFTFSLVQLGLSSANRILGLVREETELDENEGGRVGQITGEIVFDHVSFSYDDEPVLNDLSFTAKAGETVAIVGETGSGKSTLTKLVNRIYDVSSGRILVDGTDVKDWNLNSLRGQISTIEQDIQLFSRPIAENIAFSLGQRAEIHEIERAAIDAQADEFIREMSDGYDTVIGERGVTLSGGQRQRIAIARALLTDPRILMIDDSTSAIDSATEDQIQRAIRRVLEGRTTLLITHRLSQIRWADRILVLRRGRLVDQGTHDELIQRCDLYRRIFAHYEPMQPITSDRENEPAIV